MFGTGNDMSGIIFCVKNQQPLPPEKRDHALTGDYSGYRECHVHPDFLLVYNLIQLPAFYPYYFYFHKIVRHIAFLLCQE